MADLVGEGDVGDFRGDVGGVVLHGDDAGVQGLPLPVRVHLALLADAPRASCENAKQTGVVKNKLCLRDKLSPYKLINLG